MLNNVKIFTRNMSRLTPSWGGIPFVIALGIQGLPLGGGLTEVRPLYAEDVYAITSERVSSLGTSNSLLPALIWGLLYLFAVLALSRRNAKIRVLSLFRSQWPLCFLLMLVPISAIWSPNTGKVLMNFIHGFGISAVTLAAALHYFNRPEIMVKNIGHVLSANLAAQLMVIFLMPAVSIDFEGRWSGMTGQPNILGSIAYCAFWVSCAGIKFSNGWQRRIHWVELGLACVVLYGANSVTSIISSFIIVSVLYILPKFRVRPLNGGVIIVLVGFCLIIFFFFVFVIGLQNIISFFTGYGNRTSDFSGRSLIWISALDLIQLQPILGWGFDDNSRVILQTGMPHTSYHNGYLDLAVRGGIAAVLLLFFMLILFARHVGKIKKSPWFIIAVAFVISSLFYNITEVTFMSPRNIIWIIFIALLFLVSQTKMEAKFCKLNHLNMH